MGGQIHGRKRSAAIKSDARGIEQDLPCSASSLPLRILLRIWHLDKDVIGPWCHSRVARTSCRATQPHQHQNQCALSAPPLLLCCCTIRRGIVRGVLLEKLDVGDGVVLKLTLSQKCCTVQGYNDGAGAQCKHQASWFPVPLSGLVPHPSSSQSLLVHSRSFTAFMIPRPQVYLVSECSTADLMIKVASQNKSGRVVGSGWAALAQAIRQLDGEKIRDCKEDIDTLLVFVRLLSPVD